jgi:hypothetical protein
MNVILKCELFIWCPLERESTKQNWEEIENLIDPTF